MNFPFKRKLNLGVIFTMLVYSQSYISNYVKEFFLLSDLCFLHFNIRKILNKRTSIVSILKLTNKTLDIFEKLKIHCKMFEKLKLIFNFLVSAHTNIRVPAESTKSDNNKLQAFQSKFLSDIRSSFLNLKYYLK